MTDNNGFVYAWKVPITLKIVGDVPDDLSRVELCLVKVGKTESIKLYHRLYEQSLAWGKILGEQLKDGAGNSRTYRNLPVMNMESKRPSIPIDTRPRADVLTRHESLLNEGGHEVKTYRDSFKDVALILRREDVLNHKIYEDESFIRSLLGLPARPDFILSIINKWNEITHYNESGNKNKRIARIVSHQIGYTELIITTVECFKKVREAFLDGSGRTLRGLTKAIAQSFSCFEIFNDITLQFTLPTMSNQADNEVSGLHCIRIPFYPIKREEAEIKCEKIGK